MVVVTSIVRARTALHELNRRLSKMVEACQTDSECNGLFSTGGTDYAIGAFTAKKGLNSIVDFVSNCPNVIDGLTLGLLSFSDNIFPQSFHLDV